jgi:hypothetical protein
MTYIDDIEALSLDDEIIDWLRAEQHPTIDAAWAACSRGDWMLQIASRCVGPVGDRRRVPLALASVHCAELALAYVPEGEDRPRVAVETVRSWARGEATIEQVRASEAATWAAGLPGQTVTEAAAWAIGAIAVAAGVPEVARAAEEAVIRTAWAAAWAAGAAARPETLARCAEIVRQHYPEPPVLPFVA